MNTKPLNPILWLWIPISFILAQIGIEIFMPHALKGTFHSEGGPHETLQFLFALGGLIYALRCLITLSKNPKPLLIIWCSIFALSCLYIAGEEVSWGQHIFDWGTPEFWSELNDQNETNLHNTSSWLDQKPRLILLIGIIVGGLIIPALQKFKNDLLPTLFKTLYPPAILAPTAALAVLVKITDKIDEKLPETVIFSRASEVEELYLFYFVLLYLIILRRRILQDKS